MKLRSLLNIINVVLILMIGNISLFSQDRRLERLSIQYRINNVATGEEKKFLQLKMIDAYINEGDYIGAVTNIAKIKKDSSYTQEKIFLEAKAEFLADNYKNSLSLLNTVDEEKLLKDYFWDFQLVKLLNYNHLLLSDSVYITLSRLYALKGKDTSGLHNEIRSLEVPKFLDVRKAARRSKLFPGAGLFYIGEKKRGTASAFLNFAFLGYAGYSIYTKHYFTAALTGLGQFMRFYNGGKRASVRIAVKRNRLLYVDYLMRANTFTQNKILSLSKNN